MRRALALVVLLLAPSVALAEDATTPAERALAWLASASNPPRAPYLVEAAAQAGHDPRAWPTHEENVFADLAPYGGADGDYYSYLRVAHAAGTSGYDPRDVNGADYVQLVRDGFDGAQSGGPQFINDDAWAILALRAAGVPADDAQIQASALRLATAQLPDGGWSYRIGQTLGATDVTGAAVAALRAAGEPAGSPTLTRARAFLDSTYDAASGGHEDNQGIAPNCQSTVWALHGYAALGVEERDASHDFLRRLQHPSGGIATGFDPDGGRYPANAFCTAEAIPLLAGARYPLPAFEPPTIAEPDARAREPAALTIAPPFESLDVRWRDPRVVGAREFTAPAAGLYLYDYLAEGPGIRARGTGVQEVLSLRPVVGAFPPSVVVHRPHPLALDLANASDPDGRIVAYEVDWGDGNVTSGTTHAYARPGAFNVSVRAQDDDGEWSAPSSFRAIVPNRAPEIAPLPTRIVGDRVAGATFRLDATDPDGDPVEGVGARTIHRAALGTYAIPVVVRDPFGAEARMDATVEIVNLPPRVEVRAPVDATAGAAIELEAEATDADGPAPSLTWSVGPRARFEPGEHTVEVVATDADGASTSTRITFRVREPDESADTAPEPVVRALDAELAQDRLTVVFDAEGYATVRWSSDAGEGERRNARSPLAIDLPGATWATLALEVASGDAKVVRQARAIAPADDAPAYLMPRDMPRGRDPEPVIVQPYVPEPVPATEQPLAPAALVTEEPRRPVPAAPAWWLALAAGAALLATRRRRGA